VTLEDVRWLWPGYVPLGKLTTFDGSPGTGKSTITVDVAARVSTGRALPDGSCSDLTGPTHVLVASAEDGASDTIKPRVLAAGGDQNRIHILGPVPIRRGGQATEQWSTPKHVPHLKTIVLHLGVQLVVIDPLSAFVSPDHNMLQDQPMRNALGPLARVAEETGCAILVVRHFTKTGGRDPKHRGGGAISVIGQARAGLIVAPDPFEPTGFVLAVAKSNLAAEAPSLQYRVVSDKERDCSRIRWGRVSPHRATDLLVEPVTEEERSDRDQIADLLRRATEEEPILCAEARAQIRASGFSVSEKTIQRAAKTAGLKARTTKSYPCQRYWAREDQALPSVDTTADTPNLAQGVPTVPTRYDGDSGPSVDSPRELSTQSNANGKASDLTGGSLGDLPAPA